MKISHGEKDAARRSLGASLPSVLLPAHVAVAIRRIAAELRDVPRDAVRDPRELVHWLGHRARSLEAIALSRMLVAQAPALPPRPEPLATAVAPIAASAPCPVCEARRRKARRRGVVPVGQLAFAFLDPEGGVAL